jgi:hypothetical protein
MKNQDNKSNKRGNKTKGYQKEMTTTMSHHKLSSSLTGKASVLSLMLLMVAGILFAAAS